MLLKKIQLNILKRIGKYLAKLGRLTIYYSFIFSNFNYCPVTWHFCSDQNTNKILAVFWYLKEYLLCLIVIKSFKYTGLVLLTILNVSMAIVLIRLIFDPLMDYWKYTSLY
jgi:hypothetical protein